MAGAGKLLIDIDGDLTRIAEITDGRLTGLTVVTTKSASIAGNIYLGRVERAAEQLAAAFIDIGQQRSGFLALSETRPLGRNPEKSEKISNYLAEGDKVLVQVQRDGFEGKGPKLTTRLALTGRTLVMTPGDGEIRISRRIDDGAARAHLAALLEGLVEPGEGFIVRTAAAGVAEQYIRQDIDSLREEWAAIEAGRDLGRPPSLLLAGADPVLACLRDLDCPAFGEIVINDPAAFTRARTYCQKLIPELHERLHHYQNIKPLFESFQSGSDSVEADVEAALAEQVSLPSGGRVHFSETPALIAIDVDAGGTARGGAEETALQTNLDAADEIARQIRLRNLGGLLVIDFVSMKRPANQSKLLDRLKSAVSGDPVPVFVGGFTRFGLVELTRKRQRATLAEVMASHIQGEGIDG
ncbi:MAG: Rne/Rng family ribonuclease [Rhodospirillaceae bacterium]|nr:Rne/Rng family ribonuclease [Rhodospirillaceae bacterium]